MEKTFGKIALLCCLVLLVGAGCFSLTEDDSVATTGPAGVFVSTDKGNNWKQVSLLPEAEGVKNLSKVSVYRLENDPQDAKALYWASRADGLFFSFDQGVTWNQSTEPLDDGFVYSVAVSPSDKCTIFATNGLIVYRTTDCNRGWEEVHRESNKLARISSLAFDPHGGSSVYMSKISGDVLVSSDLGLSWNRLNRFSQPVDKIELDPNRAGRIYVATRKKGLFRSDDGGNTWLELDKPLKEFSKALNYRRMLVHPNKADTLFWISTYGILKSTNGGDNWIALNLINPPGSVDIYGFAVNPNNDNEMYYTAEVGNRSTFYRTADGGATWSTKKLPSGQIPTVLHVHPEDGNIVYVGFTIPPR